MEDDMIATIVYVDVIPEYVDEFVKITTYNHENSRKEPGNVRFDVLSDNDDPAKFVLYEVYRDTESAAAHKETEHYKKWAEAMEHILAAPRYKISNTDIAFT